jgi:hypothetical protein
METPVQTRTCLATLLTLWALPIHAGCETGNPTHAIVANAYPVVAHDGGVSHGFTVYRLWWTTTLFHEPIVPGATSLEQRVVKDHDYAYALVARDWDANLHTRPEHLLAMRSNSELSVDRGQTLHIRVDDQTFLGNCAVDQPLTQDEADFITQRIFPGDFTGLTYDAASCETSPLAADGGVSDNADFDAAASP